MVTDWGRRKHGWVYKRKNSVEVLKSWTRLSRKTEISAPRSFQDLIKQGKPWAVDLPLKEPCPSCSLEAHFKLNDVIWRSLTRFLFFKSTLLYKAVWQAHLCTQVCYHRLTNQRSDTHSLNWNSQWCHILSFLLITHCQILEAAIRQSPITPWRKQRAPQSHTPLWLMWAETEKHVSWTETTPGLWGQSLAAPNHHLFSSCTDLSRAAGEVPK